MTRFSSPRDDDVDVIEEKMVLLLDILFRMRQVYSREVLPDEYKIDFTYYLKMVYEVLVEKVSVNTPVIRRGL